MPFALIPFLLLIVPVLEIAVFILVGGTIGLWPTLGLVVVTAIGGSILLRRQGISTVRRIQAEVNRNRVPGRELVNGVFIAVAGVLLLTPGFVTDTLGFLLFVPGVRDGIYHFFKNRVVVASSQSFSGGGGFAGRAGKGAGPGAGAPRGPAAGGRGGPDVVDLSGEEFSRRPDPSSPWHDEKTGGDRDRAGDDPSETHQGSPNADRRTLH